MMSLLCALVQTKHSKPGRHTWNDGIWLYDTDFPKVLLERRCTKLRTAGFTIPHGMANSLMTGSARQTVAEKTDDYLGLEFIKLIHFHTVDISESRDVEGWADP